MSDWRLASRSAIALALKDLPPGADKTKAIDNAYPFDIRKHYPYKIWLEERKTRLQILGLWKLPKGRICKYHPNGQTCLICIRTK